jgi:hypothetical protein
MATGYTAMKGVIIERGARALPAVIPGARLGTGYQNDASKVCFPAVLSFARSPCWSLSSSH